MSLVDKAGKEIGAASVSHVDGGQWTPDLIWFDNLRAYGTPGYYVQKLYANNKGSAVVPTLKGNNVITGQDSVYASAVVDSAAGELVIKLVNAAAATVPVAISVQEARKLDATAGLLCCEAMTSRAPTPWMLLHIFLRKKRNWI